LFDGESACIPSNVSNCGFIFRHRSILPDSIYFLHF
jgi:hypothetical protein